MRFAVFQAMALSLWRDRAAFGLTFILPPIIFLIFAAVFSSAASGDIAIKLGVTQPADDAITAEIVDGLSTSSMVYALKPMADERTLREAIRAETIDAGIEITRPDKTQAPAFRIFYDPVKTSAAAIAEAALAAQQPRDNEEEGGDEEDGDNTSVAKPAARIAVTGAQAPPPMAAYYAAGVGMLFVFLSGFQAALSVIEERDDGVLERIAAGPFGLRPMIDGKFAFLVVQGIGQFCVLLGVAALMFGVSLTQSPVQLLITILLASVCAAGLALGVVGACRSRSQAHAIGAVLALVMGALGGSMAPRFLMAPEIRQIGALTPNAWGIDAFAISLWRGGGLDLLVTPWALLLVTGLAGLIAAYGLMGVTMKHR
ncbi:MAG: ABC transporter permease [Pseudomonadota bacterium]